MMTEHINAPTPAPAFPGGTILGYPRIGQMRELKKALEAFWKGTISEAELEAAAADLRAATRARLSDLGLDATDSSIPSNFSFYDHVLDAAVTFGAVPSRFNDLRAADGGVDLAGYSTIARGVGNKAPLEMTKWFVGPTTMYAAMQACGLVNDHIEGCVALRR